MMLLTSVIKTGHFTEYTFADIITRYKFEVFYVIPFYIGFETHLMIKLDLG